MIFMPTHFDLKYVCNGLHWSHLQKAYSRNKQYLRTRPYNQKFIKINRKDTFQKKDNYKSKQFKIKNGQ